MPVRLSVAVTTRPTMPALHNQTPVGHHRVLARISPAEQTSLGRCRMHGVYHLLVKLLVRDDGGINHRSTECIKEGRPGIEPDLDRRTTADVMAPQKTRQAPMHSSRMDSHLTAQAHVSSPPDEESSRSELCPKHCRCTGTKLWAGKVWSGRQVHGAFSHPAAAAGQAGTGARRDLSAQAGLLWPSLQGQPASDSTEPSHGP